MLRSCCTPQTAGFRRLNNGWFHGVVPTIMPAAMACGSDAEQVSDETYRLPVDVIEKNGAFVVTASVPGFRKNEISVEFHEGTLTVAAIRSASTESSGPAGTATPTADPADESVTWHRRERRTVNVTRSIRMPDGVTGEGVSASVVDGVLTVTVPQTPSKKPQKVQIN
ncbi:MAG: Hsp20/alpha crystallin family protein [Phycisphaerae bacterium]|nr:Hsp20/alpha crystallin family protein [Phycisphaerae bacterium]